jgi:hypothetical protein
VHWLASFSRPCAGLAAIHGGALLGEHLPAPRSCHGNGSWIPYISPAGGGLLCRDDKHGAQLVTTRLGGCSSKFVGFCRSGAPVGWRGERSASCRTASLQGLQCRHPLGSYRASWSWSSGLASQSSPEALPPGRTWGMD